MRKTIILVTLFFSFLNVKAQQVENPGKIGVDFSMGNSAIGRQNILPSITFSKGKHTAFVGPAFIYGIAYNPYPPMFGVQAGYKFFPNGQNKRFNLFFEYDFNWAKKQFKESYYPWHQHSVIKKSVIVSTIDNYLGFGFKLNICKAVYFQTNVGLGLIMYKEEVSKELSNGEIWNTKYESGPKVGRLYPYNSIYGAFDDSYYYSRPHLIGIFKAGIGIDICSLGKKIKQENK